MSKQQSPAQGKSAPRRAVATATARAIDKPTAGKAAPVTAPAATPAAIEPAARVAAPAAKDREMTEAKTETKNTAEQAQAQTKAIFADANDRAKGALEKGSKLVEEFNSFGKGNVEALVESSKIAAKGAEDIARYTADYARATVEKANATARQFASVKSPTEFFQLQSEVAKSAFDAIAAEGAKFAENYVKLLGEVAQPIQNRFALAAERAKLAA